jgi:hypothetical protein
VQPEIEIPAGMARHNKQTSVKNRRMNPPRPALSSRGTVTPEPVGKIGLKQTSRRWGGSKNPSARHLKGDNNWENSLWHYPSTLHDWPATGKIR